MLSMECVFYRLIKTEIKLYIYRIFPEFNPPYVSLCSLNECILLFLIITDNSRHSEAINKNLVIL